MTIQSSGGADSESLNAFVKSDFEFGKDLIHIVTFG